MATMKMINLQEKRLNKSKSHTLNSLVILKKVNMTRLSKRKSSGLH